MKKNPDHYIGCLSWCVSLCSFFIFTLHIPNCAGHGRLIEPPSRASAWRYGFPTLPDYNDHELYCGGFTRQWKENDGKCGECGDAWDLPTPRPHENGGQWGQGVIVRKYNPEAEMTIRIELTASHMGYFEFRLCPQPNSEQECYDRYLLKLLGGSPSQPDPLDLDTRFYPRNGSRIYEIKALLPDIKCSQCVLQWRYIAGNNWGICPDGNGAVGCGPQEEFRSCSDISIGDGVRPPMRPLRPTSRTTKRPTLHSTTTETTLLDEHSDDTSSVTSLVVGLLLFIIFCLLAIWYIYNYQGHRFKNWLESTTSRFCWKQNKEELNSTKVVIQAKSSAAIAPITFSIPEKQSILSSPPVPPPRTKRLSQVKEMSPDESSIA